MTDNIYDNYEDELECLINKVEGQSDDDWIDLVDKLELDVHPDSLRKSFSGGRYGGYRVAKFYQQKIENEIFTSEELRLLDAKKADLYKERVRLQDARREYNKLLREEARYENLVEVMENKLLEQLPLEHYVCKADWGGNVEAALLLSDIHYGLLVDNVLREYNTDVCKEALKELYNKVVYRCGIHHVNTLHINLLGDLIAGRIHLGSRVDSEEDVISQVLEISELLAQFINELAKHVAHIKVYGVIGNHSRVDSDKKSNLPAENFERLIFKYISMRLDGINVQTNGLEDWISYTIKDKLVFATHGDKDKISNMKTNATTLLGNNVPDIIYSGHIHHLNITDDNNTLILSNGSIVSVDEYAMSIRKASTPYQILQVFDNDIITYKLDL